MALSIKALITLLWCGIFAQQSQVKYKNELLAYFKTTFSVMLSLS